MMLPTARGDRKSKQQAAAVELCAQDRWNPACLTERQQHQLQRWTPAAASWLIFGAVEGSAPSADANVSKKHR